jgi:hypothetical protein
MKRVILISSTTVLMAVAAVLYFRSSDPSPATVEHEEIAPVIRSSAEQQAGTSPQALPDQPAPSVEPRSLSVELQRAADYFDFADSLLEPAKGGDPDAQYYLFVALDYCDETHRAFFRKPNGTSRTLDEALQRVSTRPAESVEVVRAAHARCTRLHDRANDGFGVAADWLRLATEKQQPLALATRAESLLLNPNQSTSSASADSATSPASPDATTMLITALKSKDPEVVWRIGGIQALLDGTDEERMLRQWSWWLAACQRGYDCENSRWMEYNCRFDQMCAQDRNAVDFIRRLTDLDFPEIESRAKEINRKIDSGAWDELGFGGPTETK